jgi:hypothetical protein
VEDAAGEVVAQLGREFRQEFAGELTLLIDGNAEAQAELGVVLEEELHQAGPRPPLSSQ